MYFAFQGNKKERTQFVKLQLMINVEKRRSVSIKLSGIISEYTYPMLFLCINFLMLRMEDESMFFQLMTQLRVSQEAYLICI